VSWIFPLTIILCAWGVDDLSSKETLEERKANVLIKLRGYKLLKREELKNAISLTVKLKDGAKALIWVIPTEQTVGVAYTAQLKKAMNETEVKSGIIVTSGKYTSAAKLNAKKKGIELIPRIFPSFNIFDHEFVPKHEILTAEERKKLLAEYKVHPYQLPEIKASDLAVKVIGARPGDIIRVIRKSPTAGKYVAYRHVIEG
jgi:DNA-directed RNA polymerase subunit H